MIWSIVNSKLRESAWVKNISLVFAGKIIAMLFYQLFDIVVARKLSIQEYGEWAFFFSILSVIFYIGWFGVNESAKVFISKADNNEKRNTCVKAALFLRFLVSFAVTTIIIIAAPVLAGELGYPDRYPNLLMLLYIGAFIVFINSYLDFFKCLYQSGEHFNLMGLATVIEYFGYFVFAVIFLNLNNNVYTVVISYGGAGLITLLFDSAVISRKIKLRGYLCSWRIMCEIAKYAVPLAAISIGLVLLAEIDIVMLGLFGSKSDVSIYSISKHICDKAIHVNEALITGTVLSLAVINKNNIDEKIGQFRKLNRVNFIVSLLTGCFLFFIGSIGIEILYGESYYEAGQIMYMLIPYYIIFGITNLFTRILDYHGGAWARSKWFVFTILINIILDYLLIPEWGAKGAAFATVVSLVPYTIYTVFAIKKLFLKYR